MKIGRTILALWGVAWLIGPCATGPLEAGVVSYIKLNTLTADADSGIDAANYYTHLLDFEAGGSATATVNGVAFTSVGLGNIDSTPGFSYTVGSGTRDQFASGVNDPTGVDPAQEIYNLLWDFVYNGGNELGGVATITLSNLIPGADYDTRIYNRSFGAGGTRRAQWDFDTNGDGVPEDTIATLNLDDASLVPPSPEPPAAAWNADTAYALSYQFTAESNKLTIALTQQDGPNVSWHVHGLTNEEDGVTELTWTGAGPGNWNSANWTGSGGAFPDIHANTTVQNHTVTVTQPEEARTLTVASGGIAIAGGQSLRIGLDADFAAGTTLTLAPDAAFSAGLGNIPAIAPAGDVTIGATAGTLQAAGYDDGGSPRVFTKTGDGTLVLDNDNGTDVVASQTTIRIEGGTLDTRGVDPLGGAQSVTLAGGGLIARAGGQLVRDISTGYDNATGLTIDSDLPDDDYSIDPTDPQEIPTVVREQWPIAPGVWVANSQTSKWVGFEFRVVDEVELNSYAPPGVYQYTTSVSLDTFDPAKVAIQGDWAADDAGIDVLINGISTGVAGGGFGGLSPLVDTGAGLFQTGENTITFRVSNGGASENPTGLRVDARVYETTLDLSSKTITVDGGGTLDLRSPAAVDVGLLVMKQGALATAGASRISFQQTDIDELATAIGFNPAVDTDLGVVDGHSAAVAISKVGPGDLVLDGPNVNLENATFDVQEGRLVGVHGSNPFGEAVLNVGGGELVLAGKTSNVPVTFDNSLNVSTDGTVTAAPADTGTTGVVATLGSGDNGVAVGDDCTLELSSDDAQGYALDVAGAFGGNGTVRVNQGVVTLSGGGRIRAMEVTGGTVGTGDGRVIVDESLMLDVTPYTINAENSFAVGSAGGLSDLLAETDLTLSGGTLTVGTPTNAGVVKDISTGLDNATGEVIDGGLPDPDYVIDPPGGLIATVLPEAYPIPPWVANDDRSKWLGFDNPGSNADPVIFDFSTTVSLDGYDPATAVISAGEWSADNTAMDILINDQSTGTAAPGGFNVMWPFGPVGQGLFQDGINTITFRFENAPPGLNPAGLRVRAEVSAQPLTDRILQQHVNLVVTASSNLRLGSSQGATFGDLTMDPGVTLRILGGEAGVADLRAGHDATIEGAIAVDGVLALGDSPGRLNVGGGLEMGENTVYRCDIAEWDSTNVADPWNPIPPTGPVNDRIQMTLGDALLGGSLQLTATDKLHPPVQAQGQPPGVMVEWYGDQTRVIAAAGGENSVMYEFDAAPPPQPEVYDLPGTGNWGQGHIGHGAFLTRTSGDDPVVHPGITYNSYATEVHLFQAADGDTNGDRRLGSLDVQAILSANTFPDVQPAGWPQGDFTGDGWCNGLDIQAILATGLYPFLPGPYAAVDPGEPGDQVVDLLLYANDFEGDQQYPPGEAGMLMVSTGEVTINGYVIRSAAGVFTGEPMTSVGDWFVEDTDNQISDNMGFQLTGRHNLGKVVGPEWEIISPTGKSGPVNPYDDLTFTYTVVGVPGTFVGNLIVVPEPGTAAMLIAGVLGLLLVGLRRTPFSGRRYGGL